MNKMKKISSELSLLHQDFNSRTQIGNTFPNQTLYKNLAESFQKWSIFMQKNAINVKEHIVENIKHTEKELNCINELIDIRTKTGIVYYSNWRNLETKKSKLFKMGFSKDWKLNLEGTGLSKPEVVTNETLSKYLMLPKV